MKGSLPFPLFQCWKQINIHEAFATLFGERGGGVITDEKGVFVQIQNTIVSLKALVLVKCLNTFGPDCSHTNCNDNYQNTIMKTETNGQGATTQI